MIFRRILEYPSSIEELIKYLTAQTGIAAEKARAYVYAVTSPRKFRHNGDPRGSVSAQGHLYYVERDASKRYHIHPRNPPLPPLKRPQKTSPEELNGKKPQGFCF
jgi:hypothetical protein